MTETTTGVVTWLGPGRVDGLDVPENLHAAVLVHDDSPQAFEDWVANASTELWLLTQMLRNAGGTLCTRLVVVVAAHGDTDRPDRPESEASFAGLRAMVLSLAAELRTTVRINIVRADHHNVGALNEALAYVGSEHGAYLTGSTIDLVGSGRR